MTGPLLFLDFDDVLCLNWPLGGHDLGQAIRCVAVDGRPAREFQHVWDGVFDASCVSRLLALHDEFNLRYVVSSSWALLMNKAALQFGLAQCGLGFVVDNLHGAWQTPKNYGRASDRAGEVLAWINEHPQEAAAWGGARR